MNNFSKLSASLKGILKATPRPVLSEQDILQIKLELQHVHSEREQALMAQLLDASSELRRAEREKYELELALRDEISNLKLQVQEGLQTRLRLQEQVEILQQQLTLANRRRSLLTLAPRQATSDPASGHGSAIAAKNPLQELLSFDDIEFVRNAYLVVLGREPDPEGMRYYTARLHKGISKIHVLAQLRLSPEGRQSHNNTREIDVAIQRHRLMRTALLPLFWLVNKLRTQILLRKETASMALSISGALREAETLPTPPSQRTVVEYERLSPRARSIYFQIKAAIRTEGQA